MQPYKNLNGKSGVVAYELGPDHIRIRFDNGHVYTYDYRRPGHLQVEHMKRLATTGRGLCSYISQVVGKNFAKKDSEI
ncbi:hypothetical protein [Cupriavidus neocaledonicus]|uniref:KTSC domain-containing protein n=1 Tax=Cupriavidus neocaledonicus TaxID=1040979 RepID=A0A375H9Y7_9BURK|nr:hypothetical protein [Cupriavidus neocaledonicus]SOZ35739.1 conserved hypothetical protein [Cupriavidus neocaledonicus]SPD47706.1 conserved protein of unknown function [Cupriavidus neocaledonicus]